MTEQNTFQLSGSAAQIYEEQTVPALFRPLAELTLNHVTVQEGDRVLDVACGTGIVARLVAEKVGPSGTVTGVDLNSGMIEAAQRYSSATSVNIEWHQSDVTGLPFADASFDIAFCQQGLQFFPDKPAALSEMQRVLAPGGTLVLTVWSAISPLMAAVADAAGQYISPEAATSALSPFAFRDIEVIKALVREAGFPEIEVENLEVERRIGAAAESIPKEIASLPVGELVAKLDESTEKALYGDIEEALKDFVQHDGIVVPQEAHLIRATRP